MPEPTVEMVKEVQKEKQERRRMNRLNRAEKKEAIAAEKRKAMEKGPRNRQQLKQVEVRLRKLDPKTIEAKLNRKAYALRNAIETVNRLFLLFSFDSCV